MRSFGGLTLVDWENKPTRFSQTPYFFEFGQSFPQNFEHFTTYFPDGRAAHGTGIPPSFEQPVWLAGVLAHTSLTNSFKILKRIYEVKKPWGKEEWLSGEHPLYCFKRITIHKGHRTSLQYHQEKVETNVLCEGKLRLHFLVQGSLTSPTVASVDVEAPLFFTVNPLTLHRMEALTDLSFFETSTPQVDDVVRLSDDNKRPDGRIHSEHGK